MEIGLLIIILILVVVIGWQIYLGKNQDNTSNYNMENELKEKINSLEAKMLMNQELSQNQLNNLDGSFARRSNLQNVEIQNVLANLELKLLKSSEVSQTQVQEIIVQIEKIKNLENKIGTLEHGINEFSQILANKQLRGAFGEQRLREIFTNHFGQNTDIVSEQVKLSNEKRVDFLLDLPSGIPPIAIDVKFPLENYQKYINSPHEEQAKYYKLFVSDVKNHIKVIANKYIIPGETASQAIMFIPSETVYYEVLAENNGLLNFGYQQNVWIASPTTIMALINILSGVYRDLVQNEKANEIKSEINQLGEEFDRYQKRLSDYEKRFEQLEQEREKLQITSRKIINKFEKIKSGEFEA